MGLAWPSQLAAIAERERQVRLQKVDPNKVAQLYCLVSDYSSLAGRKIYVVLKPKSLDGFTEVTLRSPR